MNEKLNAQDLWERIRVLSARKSVLQKDWCEALGLDVQIVRNKIFRKAFPSVDELVGIAKYFGVSTDYLLTGEKTPETEKVDELKERMNQIIEIAQKD
jgi:transcriptional regulator with XRE-family HTH domain